MGGQQTGYGRGEAVFNWYSAPTFAAMLLFWVLGAYVLTRSPRSAISLTAVGAQFATALYLLGQVMVANAQTLEEWHPWQRGLAWSPHAAVFLWYLLTFLLLNEQHNDRARLYVRYVGFPALALHLAASLFFGAANYVGDSLHLWSQVTPSRPGEYSIFELPDGQLFIGWVSLLAVSTLMSFVNVAIAARVANDSERQRCFRWLLVSSILFVVGANGLGIFNWATGGAMSAWVGHVLLGMAMVIMAWNVAAYSLLFKGQVVRTDFFYMLTALGLVCGLYGTIFLLARTTYSFQLLTLIVITLSVAILSHAFVDLGRRILDRLFFGDDVQKFRWNLKRLIQDVVMTDDFDKIIKEAQEEMDGLTEDHLVRITEQALRRLNNPAALGRTELAAKIPKTLDSATRETLGRGLQDVTPLEKAQAVRSVLISGIERLEPLDGDTGPESPATLQYHILHEEYLQGLLNKQIMVRHSISEGTFNRNRRQAIAMLAEELDRQEELASREKVAVSGGSAAPSGS